MMKRQNRKEIFANHIANKRFTFRIYKELSKLKNKKNTKILLENGQKT